MNKKKILVLDDDENIIKSFKMYLSDKFELFTTTNGIAALNIVFQQDIDLILLDLNLPIIDGETLLFVLNKNKNWNNIPVIIISGYKKPSINLPENVKGYLGKPIIKEDLLHAINNLLQIAAAK